MQINNPEADYSASNRKLSHNSLISYNLGRRLRYQHLIKGDRETDHQMEAKQLW